MFDNFQKSICVNVHVVNMYEDYSLDRGLFVCLSIVLCVPLAIIIFCSYPLGVFLVFCSWPQICLSSLCVKLSLPPLYPMNIYLMGYFLQHDFVGWGIYLIRIPKIFIFSSFTFLIFQLSLSQRPKPRQNRIWGRTKWFCSTTRRCLRGISNFLVSCLFVSDIYK